jgi:hypothetical protein
MVTRLCHDHRHPVGLPRSRVRQIFAFGGVALLLAGCTPRPRSVSPLSPGLKPDPREKCFVAQAPPPSPTPTAAGPSPTVRGTLDKEDIRQVIRNHLHEVKWCYDIRLASGQPLQGRVAYQFIIAPDGSVPRSTVLSTTMHDPDVETCVGRATCRWTFPRPTGGGIVIVTYPFAFTPEHTTDAQAP